MQRMQNVPMTLAGLLPKEQASSLVAESGPNPFGVYQPTGCLGSSNGSDVYLGKDVALDRRVWIFTNPHYELTSQRKSLNRSGRLRVLSESTDATSLLKDAQPWQITEAVEGMPLVDLMARGQCKWDSVRPVFQELASELNTGVSDGSLPVSLKLEQVWVDRAGRLKLLDQPLGSGSGAGASGSGASGSGANEIEPESPVQDDEARAKNLLCDLMKRYMEKNSAPLHVYDFERELRTETGRNLVWARTQLDDFAERPSSWKWDDRLGTISVSAGLELPALMTVILTLGVGILYLWREDFVLMPLILTGISMSLAFAIGALMKGGPALRFSKIRLCRNKTYQTASRFRCGLRNVITWLPTTAVLVLVFVVLQFSFADGDLERGSDRDPSLMIVLLVSSSIPILLILLLGMIQAIVRPRRAIADWIAGTTLVRE